MLDKLKKGWTFFEFDSFEKRRNIFRCEASKNDKFIKTLVEKYYSLKRSAARISISESPITKMFVGLLLSRAWAMS